MSRALPAGIAAVATFASITPRQRQRRLFGIENAGTVARGLRLVSGNQGPSVAAMDGNAGRNVHDERRAVSGFKVNKTGDSK